jgi:hypothetical protein
VKVQLLYVRDCPHLAGARSALQRVLAQLGLPVAFDEVELGAPDAPPETRGWGSPTILVDERDVAGETAMHGEPRCRVYGNPIGRPTDEQIASALRAARGL